MSQSLKITDTPLQGLSLIERNIIKDDRGEFFRVYCKEELSGVGLLNPLDQINFNTAAEKFTTKGIHFQLPPFAEEKIITCTRGEIFDVAVDLRKGSPTFLQYYSVILSDKNNLSLLIPKGFGHGWQSLKDNSSIIYLHTSSYSPDFERGVNIFDPLIGIEWPNTPAHLSKRDREFEYLTSDFAGIEI